MGFMGLKLYMFNVDIIGVHLQVDVHVCSFKEGLTV